MRASLSICSRVVLGALALLHLGCAPVEISRGRTEVQATCPPEMGMTEQRFLACGCAGRLLSPMGGTRLMSAREVAGGIQKVYQCDMTIGGRYQEIIFLNGVVSDIRKP